MAALQHTVNEAMDAAARALIATLASRAEADGMADTWYCLAVG